MSNRLRSWRVILYAVCLCVLAHIPAPLAAQTPTVAYYYYHGTRVLLPLHSRLVAVRFLPNLSPTAQRDLARASGDVDDPDAGVTLPVGALVIFPLRAGTDPLMAVKHFEERAGVAFASPVYQLGATQLIETDEFLVRFKSTLSQTEIETINRTHGATLVRRLPFSDRVFVLKPQAGNPRSALELANAYVEGGWVEFAEPNFVIRTLAEPAPTLAVLETTTLIPNDTYFGLQWSLRNTQQFLGSVAGADINATNAWGVSQGASSIKIAIIDEGVSSTHPDLAGKLLPGYNALNGTNNASPNPNDYHGTAVAGIAAANSNNAQGIAGVCWFCRILPVKVAERDAQGNWTATVASLSSGIDWAWQNGADVLNNSWTMHAPSDSVQLAIINARLGGRGGNGSTVVFATGNANADTVPFPASLNAYVIAVGASNWCDQRKTPTNNACNNNDPLWGSNYGRALDLLAPGEVLYTTCNGNQCLSNGYIWFSGTSAAAPLVSGAAALLYALNPNLTPDQIQQALQNGAQDLGAPGRDDETGYGRLDAYRAIAAMYDTSLTITTGKTLVLPETTVTFTLSYANTGMSAMALTQLRVTVPPNAVYVSSKPKFTPQGGGIYTLDLGTLDRNQTGKAKFRVRSLPNTAGQSLTLTASIGGAFPELNTANNTAIATVYLIQQQYFLPFIIK